MRAFIERAQIRFLRSPMGKGVMPDNYPLSAARTLALQNAVVVFPMGTRFNCEQAITGEPTQPAMAWPRPTTIGCDAPPPRGCGGPATCG